MELPRNTSCTCGEVASLETASLGVSLSTLEGSAWLGWGPWFPCLLFVAAGGPEGWQVGHSELGGGWGSVLKFLVRPESLGHRLFEAGWSAPLVPLASAHVFLAHGQLCSTL